MLKIYKILINTVCLFAIIILKIRILKKKEDKKRYTEKLSVIKIKRTKGKWFI